MENNKIVKCEQIGDVICSPNNDKYEILQKINSAKTTSQQPVSTYYQHLDTFIVKKQSDKTYYIIKRYELFQFQKLKQVKESPCQSPSKGRNIIKQLRSKILIHPNLLQIEDVFFQRKQNQQKQQKYLNLVEQYCEQGDLAYFIKVQKKKNYKTAKKELFPQKLIAKWLLQILLALEHLHFNKLAHQIINPANIYLTPLGNLKLNEAYLLNSINGGKQFKNSKETSPPLDRYQPSVDEKKFKINQKKDIIDFGVLISYFCNQQASKDAKKHSKIKFLAHLPPTFSQNLDKIYVDCINIKKTCILVNQILKSSYFLGIMRQFIIDKKLNVSVFERIPIKKYTIHKKVTSPKTQKQMSKQEQKSQIQKFSQGKLPKIQKGVKSTESRIPSKKVQLKNQAQVDDKKIIRASLQKLKSKMQLNRKQVISKQKKNSRTSIQKQKGQVGDQKKNDKDKPRILTPISTGKYQSKNYLLLPPPSLQKNRKKNTKSQKTDQSQENNVGSNRQQIRSKQKLFKQTISRSQSHSPKKPKSISNQFHLTPQITFGKKKYDQRVQFSVNQRKTSEEVRDRSADSRQNQLQKISQNLAKIFCDLKIRQDDDEQFSFQLDEQEQEQLRLTFKQSKQTIQGQDSLMKTYKNKFQQMICQLQQKYQPNLQTIIQKTHQWDSNDFFVNQQLFKRLKQQQKQSLLPSLATQTQKQSLETHT